MLGPQLKAYENGYIASSTSTGNQRLQELARVSGVSRAFTLSVKLDLYTLLREWRERKGVKGLTAEDIATGLGLKTHEGFRGVRDWLDLLVTLALLDRTARAGPSTTDSAAAGDNSNAAALYSNTTEADVYLAKQSPNYMGGHAVLCHDRQWHLFTFLEHALKTGVKPEIASQLVAPALATFAGTTSEETATGGDPLAFAMAMTGCNKAGFEAFASKFDFSRYRSLGDIGGSAGVLCCCVAAAHTHMSCTTHDLPAVHDAAVQYVQDQGLSGRAQVCDMDFLADGPFPSYDVITMGMILHGLGLAKKKLLMQKAYDALPAGGAFIAIELLIDDQRRQNTWGLLMSLNMLLEFESEGSFDFTFQDFTSWAKEIGFKETEVIRLTGPNSAAIAYK